MNSTAQPGVKMVKPSDKQIPEPKNSASMIPVVGIGGSAGALDPFKSFFQAMPADSGAAFIVIQHLSPDQKSLLPELLEQHTRMKVLKALDGAPVKPDCVYVIPPNKYLAIRDGILHLTEPEGPGGIRMAIDFFFRSLAEDRGERAVGIVFSGADSDGSQGIRAIRGAGGLAVAQDPETADFGDMPRGAIATGLVDYVLSPELMPMAVMNYLRHDYIRGKEASPVLDREGKPGDLGEIMAIILNETGRDFRCYKKNTILRRIERRMMLHRIPVLAEYARLLGRDSNEVNRLLKDLLINVTSFFRDPETFEVLARKVITPLVAARQAGEPLRVWSAGCSTGEEVYSLVMLLIEELDTAHKNCPLQVYATDIDEEALQIARQGIYPGCIGIDVSPNRLSRFFVKKGQGYQVGEALRNSVVFAVHNLVTDPPFSRMDLISCRNLLIYLDADTQSKLFPLFNFALNPNGYLFLGKSEGVIGQNDLFGLVSKKARIYRRSSSNRQIPINSPILSGRKKPLPLAGSVMKSQTVIYSEIIREALLGHFAASLVLVDSKGQILQFHGQTGKYLEMPTAEPNLNLLDVAREGLSLRLRSAIHASIDEGRTVMLDPLQTARREGAPWVRITVSPFDRRGYRPPHDRRQESDEGGDEQETLLAVVFEDVPRPSIPVAGPPEAGGDEIIVRRLEDELRATQQDLQTTIEELQASNEEMRISNEEVVSANEELQSTNEELETSKEELQSVNEELTTVNSQLHEKVEQLDESYNDMANLLKSTRIATLFLDKNLRIKFFTKSTTKVLNLIQSDIGRQLSDMSLNLVDFDLAAEAVAVARNSAIMERDVRHADGSSFVVSIMPYFTKDERSDGVVVTFDDVTRLRRAEERTRLLATAVTDSNDAVFLVDLEGNIREWNRGARRIYGWSEDEALRINIRDMVPPDRKSEISDHIRRVLEGDDTISVETKRFTKDGRLLDVWLTATALRDDAKKATAIVFTERDISERKRAEEALAETQRRISTIVDNITDGFYALDSQWRFTHVNNAAIRHFRKTREHLLGRTLLDVFPATKGTIIEAQFQRAFETGMPVHFEVQSTIAELKLETHAYPGIDNLTVLFRDITERSKIEAALHQAHDRATWLARFPDENPSPVLRVASDGTVLYCNPAAARDTDWMCGIGGRIPGAFESKIMEG